MAENENVELDKGEIRQAQLAALDAVEEEVEEEAPEGRKITEAIKKLRKK